MTSLYDSRPSGRFADVSPSDTTDLTEQTRALYVGGEGDLEVDTVDGKVTVVFHNVQEGSILPLKVRRVRAANTTATNIVALF